MLWNTKHVMSHGCSLVKSAACGNVAKEPFCQFKHNEHGDL